MLAPTGMSFERMRPGSTISEATIAPAPMVTAAATNGEASVSVEVQRSVIAEKANSAAVMRPSAEPRSRAPASRNGILDATSPLEGNNRIAADYYDGPRWAKFRKWERLTYRLSGGEQAARDEVLRHLTGLPGTRLLDAGIGDGSNFPLIPEDCQVYGIDISQTQLHTCLDRFASRKPLVMFAEAEQLPFRGGVFDNVLSCGAFNHFSDPAGALREMVRVVAPGDRIVISDELSDLPDRMPGRKVGLPSLDRWFMSRVMHLGPEFTGMVERQKDLKVEPLLREVLDAVEVHEIWGDMGYCAVGHALA